ncbi:MAG: hypothetical protein LQ338_005847 [Usnochroma carphineum]|nr:MAG: hypothetical protein LQ338_005847 [Usnochroma carphineum]
MSKRYAAEIRQGLLSPNPRADHPWLEKHFYYRANHSNKIQTFQVLSITYRAAMGSVDTARPSYGHRLLPTLVDDRAKQSPEDVFALVPKSSDFEHGLHEITYSAFAKSIDRVASWLEEIFGKSKTFETIAYIGSRKFTCQCIDIRYFIVALAATKLGFKTLFPSPRNSVEGTQSLLETTQCQRLVTSSETKVDHLLTENGPRHVVIESLAELISKSHDAVPYPYAKTYEEAHSEPFIVIHTSGSTGLPKPVTIYHGGLATVDKQHELPAFEGHQPQLALFRPRCRSFSALPPFHVSQVPFNGHSLGAVDVFLNSVDIMRQMGGILWSLATALYCDNVIIWPPPGRPVSADMIEDAVDHVEMDLCFMGPSVLEELSKSEASLTKLRKLEGVGFGGGPLAKSAGDTVSRYTEVINIIGSSESALLPTYMHDAQEWYYFQYSPKLEGIQFRPVDNDLYEMVITRHAYTDAFHSTWYTFPEQEEYATHDLYRRHPSKDTLWSYAGRSDEVIVFSNGEKLNPNAMEGVLDTHPDVKGALIIGQGRFEAVALIELRHEQQLSVEEREAFDQSFKAYIDKANEDAPSYGKLLYDHVMFTKPGKPMLRADKGTIKRSATLRAYAQEIDDFYDHLDSANTLTGFELDTSSHESLMGSLKRMVAGFGSFEAIGPDEDFFGMGMNSLQAMALTRELKSAVAATNEEAAHGVSPKLIYANATLTQLASAVKSLLDPGVDGEADGETTRLEAMEQMVEEFSSDLPRPTRLKEDNPTLVLTGSTGSLGSYILDALSGLNVKKIFCLNRRSNSEEVQRSSHAAKGLTQDWDDKVVFLQADLGRPDLGLQEDMYNVLRTEASIIIHNQYPVNFNLSLSSFKPHIAAVRNLVDLSTRSPKHPQILFTSSISTIANWNQKHPGEAVPEAPLHDYSIPAPTGYAGSKYVCERILENAAATSNVPVSVVRVGQLAGPVEKKGGMWNPKEWLPSIVASSAYLGVLPDSLRSQDDVAWVPVDLAARALVELALSSSSSEGASGQNTYNLTNPHRSSWAELVPVVQTHLEKSGHPVRVVGFDEWVRALGESAEETRDLERNPAVKLLDFYEGMREGGVTVLETERTRRASGTLDALGKVGERWLGLWLGQWGF